MNFSVSTATGIFPTFFEKFLITLSLSVETAVSPGASVVKIKVRAAWL